jgi:pimeloyl-ACP methyl ester carboxylesterase
MTSSPSLPLPTPFKIAVSDGLLSFIDQRVATARIIPGLDLPKDEAWSYGVPPATISQLRDYWVEKYNWRAVEARINGHLTMFTLPISEAGEELTIHFVHHRSDHEGAIPLLFQHGWPGSFLEVDKIIDSLTSPPPGQQAYHVVAPSLPGFVFSDGAKGPEFGLRNPKYIAQGGDWGSMIVRIIALDYPASCLAVHVNMVASGPPSWWKDPLTFVYFIGWALLQDKSKDGSNLGRMMWWQREEGGYLEIQGTKPFTISYGLMDSPIGMLAWLRDKMQHLVDDWVWDEEEVITWVMVRSLVLDDNFRLTIPSCTLYLELLVPLQSTRMPKTRSYWRSWHHFWAPQYQKMLILDVRYFQKVSFPSIQFKCTFLTQLDVFIIPRWWAACTVSSNITFWKEHDKGGHFASVEVPEVLVSDIREFTKLLNAGRMTELIKSGKLKI